MTTVRTAASLNEATGNAIPWIKRGLEFLWLLTVVAVPLAFVDRESFLSESELAYVDVPKTVLLRTLVGLMAILWLVEWVLQRRIQIGYPIAGQIPYRQPAVWLRNSVGWLQGDPTRWVTLAVVLYLITTLLGTALSESFSVSMWGLVPGQDSYPAYTITCYVVLFGVIATHIKNKAQVERLLWAIALMGVLVGAYSWAQFYGYDVFNLREIPGGRLLGSTMGNSILAGSLLLMSITVSFAAATAALGQQDWTVRIWSKLGLWVVILTLQMSALVFVFNRGPWVGTAVALVALLGLATVFTGWNSLVRMGLILVLAGALTAALVLKPPPIPTAEPVRTERQEYPAPAESLPVGSFAIDQISSTAFSVGRGVGGGGLSGRISIWATSWRLIMERPWFEFESPSLPFLRSLIGYGPDTFKYAYLLERRPRGSDQILVSERFAHNILIHRGVELGFVGLLTTFSLFAAPLLVGGYQLLRQKNGHTTLHNLVLVGLMAALAGRFVEQMVGVAAVSDLTIFWLLLGVFVALPLTAEALQAGPSAGTTAHQGQTGRRTAPAVKSRFHRVQPLLTAVVVVGLIAGIGTITWFKSINYLSAGFDAHEGLDRIRESEFQSALDSLDRAIDRAPGVSVYHTLRTAVYEGYWKQDQGPKERECGRLADGAPYENCLVRIAYLGHLEAAKQRPLEWRPRLNLAESGFNLALMDRDPEMAGEAIRQFRQVAQLDPNARWHWEWLAAAHIRLGEYEAALEALARVDDLPRSANARLLHGMAYLALDAPGKALKFFNEAIRLNPNLADAYISRGATYNALGRFERAIQDLDEAIRLKPEMAMAYNNRGNSYGELDQIEKAILDYDEAIRLDNQFALAYSNRALAYAYLGMGKEAMADVYRGTELGLNLDPLLAKIKEVRDAR